MGLSPLPLTATRLPPPPLSGWRSPLRSPAARTRLPPGRVVYGSLPGCAVGGACCALRFAPARAAPARLVCRRSRLGSVGFGLCPFPPCACPEGTRRPPWFAALLWGRSPAVRAGVAPAGGRRSPARGLSRRLGRFPAPFSSAAPRVRSVRCGGDRGLLFGSARGLRRAPRGPFRGFCSSRARPDG